MTPRQLIAKAEKIIAIERKISFDSYRDVDGRITNIDERAIIANYDRWLKSARAWLKRHPR